MSELGDISKLQGDKNVFNRYDRRNTGKKVWAIVIIVAILFVAAIIYGKSLLMYTLSFDTMGGTEIPSIELEFMAEMHRPKDIPKKAGYYLAGWTKDKEGEKPFSFGSKIWWDTTIYAKWEEGVAISLNFADGEENDDLTTEQLKAQYEEWFRPGSADELPLVYNENENSPHYGERLLWFEDAACTGDPIFGKTYTLSENIEVYGKWFDVDESKFVISNDGTLKKYVGYCRNIIIPNNVRYIRDISRADYLTGSSDQIHDADSPNFSVFESVQGTLKSVYLNDGLLRIGNCAFKDCVSLTTIKSLGNSLLSIGEYAFDATLIEEFVLSSRMTSVGVNAFNGAKKLKNIVIGPQIESIESGAFANTGLVSITLPNVIQIGTKAFMGCNSLVAVYFLHNEMVNANAVTTPAMNSDACDNVFAGAATFSSSPLYNRLFIYVPESLMDDYQSSHPWSVYFDCLKPAPHND